MSNRRPIRGRTSDRPPSNPAPAVHLDAHTLNRRLTGLLVTVDTAAHEWRATAWDDRIALGRWRDAVGDERRVASLEFALPLEREGEAALEYHLAWEAWCAATG